MKVLIIIPAYNEEESIQTVVDELIQNHSNYDYIIINDGSTDHTSKICHKNHYNIIDLPVNIGLSGAFQAGMKYAYQLNYDAAIQFDADGQHHAEHIEEMISNLETNDIVIGSRFLNNKKPAGLRMLGSRLIGGLIKLTTGQTITDPTSGMRLYKRPVIAKFAKNSAYGPEPDTIAYFMRTGTKVTEVHVTMSERESGTSYLNFTNSIKYMMNTIISILFIQWFQ